MEEIEKCGYCTLCRSRCGTINTVRGDTLVAVRPDNAHPTGKAMCMKGKAAPELVHSAERILSPMRRTTSKGHPDPGWEPISWEDALTEVASRLQLCKQQSGAESVAFAVTTPSGTPLSDSIDWIERFVRLFGSPNICYATEICNWHKDVAHAFTFGSGMPTADYRNADLVMLWGHNPSNTWLAQAEAITSATKNGARLLVIDPRDTALANKADQWLQVRPGGDAALAMGLANLLIENESFDQQFISRWTNAALLVRQDNGQFLRGRDIGSNDEDAFVIWNAQQECTMLWTALSVEERSKAALRGRFDVGIRSATNGSKHHAVVCRPVFDLYAEACSSFSPQVTAAHTWIPEEHIREAARLLAQAKSVAYHAWSGIAQHADATQIERAVACLYALTGSYDREGGNRIYQKPPYNAVNQLSLLAPEQAKKALGIDKRPLGPPSQGWVTAKDLYQAILQEQPYKVRALVGFGSNLLTSQADIEVAIEALKALEFYVHCDLFDHPGARYADIFLPVNTPWEREGLRIGFEISAQADQLVQLRQQMVPAQGDSRSDNDIVFSLATRLGMADQFFGGSLERGWNHMLSPTGLSVSQLRQSPRGIRIGTIDRQQKYADPARSKAFNTPTGLVELYSENLLLHGYPALPTASIADEGNDAFPLLLTSAKNGLFCHSQHRSLGSLRRRAMHPTIEISSVLAAGRDIEDGDQVIVTTRNGEVHFIAHVNEALHPRVAIGEYGWWQGCAALGQNEMPIKGSASSNFNSLISTEKIDPVSGSTPMRSFFCNIVRDPAMSLERRRWLDWRDFSVSDLRREADGVMEVTVSAIDGRMLPDYLPGQHITLQAEIAPGNFLARSYSLTGAASEAGRRTYRICVRQALGRNEAGESRNGLMSTFINHRLRVGDRLKVKVPAGRFILPVHSKRPLVLIAGGIGITPFISLLESLSNAEDADSTPDILLLYANRDGKSHAFREQLAYFQKRLPSLRLINFYDQPEERDQADKTFHVHGRITADAIPVSYCQRRALFYLCGPTVMMDAISAALQARGIKKFDILSEIFRSPAAALPAGDAEFSVIFSRSGVTQTWRAAEGVLLNLAEKHAVAMPSGCRVGQCESCAVRIVSGSVRHLHGKEPETSDTCLTCQAIPISDLVLEA